MWSGVFQEKFLNIVYFLGRPKVKKVPYNKLQSKVQRSFARDVNVKTWMETMVENCFTVFVPSTRFGCLPNPNSFFPENTSYMSLPLNTAIFGLYFRNFSSRTWLPANKNNDKSSMLAQSLLKLFAGTINEA